MKKNRQPVHSFLRSPRSFRAARAWMALCLLVIAGGACATAPSSNRGGSIVITADGYDRERLERELPADMLQLFDRLQQLVFAREDRAARNVLARIYSRRPEGAALDMARAFERILDGRMLMESVRLELATQAHESDPDRYRVVLFAINESTQACTLRPGPATLMLEQTVVDGEGRERRNETTRTTDSTLELELLPGEPLTFPLVEFSPPTGFSGVAGSPEGMQGVLAARYVWQLSLLSGVFEVEEQSLPAMRFDVDPAERVWISTDLPEEAVHPDEFLESVLREKLSTGELMRLAVRIPPEERLLALQQVSPELEGLRLETLASLSPSLRWLSGDSRLGDDPASWRAWTASRSAAASADSTATDGLDLPESVQ